MKESKIVLQTVRLMPTKNEEKFNCSTVNEMCSEGWSVVNSFLFSSEVIAFVMEKETGSDFD